VLAELGPLDYKGLYNVMTTTVFLFFIRGMRHGENLLLVIYIKKLKKIKEINTSASIYTSREK
jgi:hypothetical protein